VKPPAVEPLEPAAAFAKALEHETRIINDEVSKNRMFHIVNGDALAYELGRRFSAKGWRVEVTVHPDSHAWIRFSWPEVK
jgi:hypothetical protein